MTVLKGNVAQGSTPVPNGTSSQLLANNGAGGFSNVNVNSALSSLQYDSDAATLSVNPVAPWYASVEDLPAYPVPDGSLAVVGDTNQLYFFSIVRYFDWVPVNDLNVNFVFTKATAGEIYLESSAANVALDFSKPNSRMVLNEDVTFDIPEGLFFLNGASALEHTLDVWQDGTGNRTITFASWPFEFPNGSIVISTDAFTRSTIKFRVSFYSIPYVTITNADPGVLTSVVYEDEVAVPAAHNFITGQTCRLISEISPPTGLADNTTYWINRIDDTTFNLAASLADLQAGTFIDTTGTQEGIYSIVASTIDVFQ